MATSVSLEQDAERLSQGIKRLMWTDSRRLAQTLAPYDLTVPQFFALYSINHGGMSCRMGDVAHRLFQSSATMTGIVTRLESDGLVERIMDPADRRAVLVRVTDHAKKLLSEVLAAERESIAFTLQRLTPRDRDEFLRLLDVYVDALTTNLGRTTV